MLVVVMAGSMDPDSGTTTQSVSFVKNQLHVDMLGLNDAVQLYHWFSSLPVRGK
jgi:hypothetical protein